VRSLGDTIFSRAKAARCRSLLLRLEDTRNVLDRVYHELNNGAERGLDISPAGDWLLADNFYIVQEHIRRFGQIFRRVLRGASQTRNGSTDRYRGLRSSNELIAHTEGHLDLDNITLFVARVSDGHTTPHG